MSALPIRKTSIHRACFDFNRMPRDLSQPQTSLNVVCHATLMTETWTRGPEGTNHSTWTESVRMELDFGNTVKSTDDIARALRALADAVEKPLSDTEITTPDGGAVSRPHE